MPPSDEKPLDYLIIGHVTKDLTVGGYMLGGTASYSSLTASAFNLRTGVLTSFGDDISISELKGIEVKQKPSQFTTTFENIQTKSGRKQYLHQIAEPLLAVDVPNSFKSAKILHLGPVADEVDATIALLFRDAFIGLTPQGWMRKPGEKNLIEYKEWEPPLFLINKADAVVMSMVDVKGNEDLIAKYAHLFRVLAITDGNNGARVYWHGDVRHFNAPILVAVDSTGAGDIFATAFFIKLETCHDPWEAASLAVNLASLSVTRKGLSGIPSSEEVQSNLVEIMPGSSIP